MIIPDLDYWEVAEILGRVHEEQRRLLLADPGIHIGIQLPCHNSAIVSPLVRQW